MQLHYGSEENKTVNKPSRRLIEEDEPRQPCELKELFVTWFGDCELPGDTNVSVVVWR